MTCVGLEPTIQAFERAKAFHTLDRAVTVIGGTASKTSKTDFLFFAKSCANTAMCVMVVVGMAYIIHLLHIDLKFRLKICRTQNETQLAEQ
jgi:hypothetical protein